MPDLFTGDDGPRPLPSLADELFDVGHQQYLDRLAHDFDPDLAQRRDDLERVGRLEPVDREIAGDR